MGKPHPVEMRERVVAFVEEGNSHRGTAAHFRVSIKFVNDMVKLKRETGGLAPKRQGNSGRGKLSGVADWVRGRVAGKGEVTLDELVVALRQERALTVHRSSVGRLLHRLGLTHKKTAFRGGTGAPGCAPGTASLDWPPPAFHARHAGPAGVCR